MQRQRDAGRVVVRAGGFCSVKVFSATLARDRDQLGERVTEWLRASRVELVEVVVTQSSDAAFHCLTMTVFYR